MGQTARWPNERQDTPVTGRSKSAEAPCRPAAAGSAARGGLGFPRALPRRVSERWASECHRQTSASPRGEQSRDGDRDKQRSIETDC